MTEFRVHFIKTDGDKTTHVVNAESPTQAAAIIRKKNPGVSVLKVKVNKAGNVSPRVNGSKIVKAVEELRDNIKTMSDAEFTKTFLDSLSPEDKAYEKQFPAALRIDRL